MEKMRLECEEPGCEFKTPKIDEKEYPAMVAHLQVVNLTSQTVTVSCFLFLTSQIQLHCKLRHGVDVCGGSDCQGRQKGKAGADRTPPPSRCSSACLTNFYMYKLCFTAFSQ